MQWYEILKISSSLCAVTGGMLVALKIRISGYGFIFLALSSGQYLVANLLIKDVLSAIYALSVFVFVDLLGIYRWLIAPSTKRRRR
jgi:hypothetical protein